MPKCREEARGCKLPTEADRPELLHPVPQQLASALLYSRSPMATDIVATFNDRQIEYGNYKLPSRPGEPAKQMLFWEFGKKIAHLLGADKDPAMIIPVERYAVDTMISLHLRELLLGESGDA